MATHSKKALKLAATLVFIDESAIALSPVVMKTWSPAGKTPVIKVKTRSHRKISAIGCIATTPKQKRIRMFFRLHAGKNVKAADCISFFDQLKQNIKGPIIVVWDRLQAHRSKKVQKYLQKEKSRIQIEFLPPYAPDLNPIEFGWSYLKTKSMYNFAAEDEEVLYKKAKTGLCEIRRERRLLKSFLKHSGLFV